MSAGSSGEMDEEQLQLLYSWIDEIPLSRPKKNITRDFSDGVLVAEVVHHFVPKLVELHNYQPASASAKKMENWNLLNRKVLGKIGYQIPESLVKGVSACKPGNIEVVLSNVRLKIESFLAKKKASGLRENNTMYDALGDESYGYPAQGQNGYYSYGEGPPYPPMQNGVDGAYPPPHGYGNYPNGPSHYPPQGMQQSPPMQYQYQSEPRQVPDLRQQGQAPGPYIKPPVRTPPRNNSQTNNKLKGKEKSNVGRAQSLQDLSDNASLRLALEEKEQALLASQETVQILQVKIRRLEHLLRLKDLRIDDLNNKLISVSNGPRQGVPQGGAPGAHMHLNQHQPLPGIQRHVDGSIR